MIEKFINWLKKQVGSIYVWGGQGEVAFNEDWIRKMETSEKNAQRAIDFYHKQLAAGIKTPAAYDCSGLIVRFLLDNDIIQSDMTANGLFVLCEETERNSLSRGDLVFRHNGSRVYHVGVYIGSDMVIHARGRDTGVVMEHIDACGDEYWNRFGRLPELSQRSDNYPRIMIYGGKTFVNLRDKPSAVSDSTVINKVTAGEEVLVLGIDNNGWADAVKYLPDTDSYVRGFCISKYLKI